MHIDAHRCCSKSLTGGVLVGFGVRQHARAESISKRAPSTTRTSLRVFRIYHLREPDRAERWIVPRIVPYNALITTNQGARRPFDGASGASASRRLNGRRSRLSVSCVGLWRG